MRTKKSGISVNTPKNIIQGAGTVHLGLMYGYYTKTTSGATGALTVVADDTAAPTSSQVKLSVAQAKCNEALSVGDYVLLNEGWNADETLLGATQGGITVTINPTIEDIEADGKTVKVQGMEVKNGEEATIQINALEITDELIEAMVIGDKADSVVISNYRELVSRAQITKDDYVKNLGLIMETLDGIPCIVIFEHARCTSGLSLSLANASQAVPQVTFACVSTLEGDHNALPYKIYWPKPAAHETATATTTESEETEN